MVFSLRRACAGPLRGAAGPPDPGRPADRPGAPGWVPPGTAPSTPSGRPGRSAAPHTPGILSQPTQKAHVRLLRAVGAAGRPGPWVTRSERPGAAGGRATGEAAGRSLDRCGVDEGPMRKGRPCRF